jgi:hypothetical protein
MLGRQVVDARARLEDLHFFDAQDTVEEIDDPGAPGRRLQHLGLAVGQDGQPQAVCLQRLQAGFHVGKGREAQVGLHEALALLGREIEREALRRVDEAILGELPEVLVAAHEAAEQAVLELLHPPELGQSISLPGKELLTQRRHREHVEERAVRIEGDGLDVLESGRFGSRGRARG